MAAAEGNLLISGKSNQTKFLVCQIPGILAGNIIYMMEKIKQMKVYLPEEYLHKLLCPEEFRN
jgi:hypothetical protein